MFTIGESRRDTYNTDIWCLCDENGDCYSPQSGNNEISLYLMCQGRTAIDFATIFRQGLFRSSGWSVSTEWVGSCSTINSLECELTLGIQVMDQL